MLVRIKLFRSFIVVMVPTFIFCFYFPRDDWFLFCCGWAAVIPC